jgi:ClpP class serine protease
MGGRQTLISSTTADIKRFEKMPTLPLVVRVTSPGGSTGFGFDVARTHAHARTKPVIISLGRCCTEYLALAGEKVFAENGTITGRLA